MKCIVSALAVAFALSVSAATAQTAHLDVSNARSARVSGAGKPGSPATRMGPAKPSDTVGSSSGTNPSVQQDTSNIKASRRKSGPAVRKPDDE